MSEARRWVRTARCADIPLREGRSVRFGGREIALFNLGERFLAVANRCPHRQGPLADGIVAGATVVCPLHAWKVNLESGEVVRPSDQLACVERFRARVEGGDVLVELPLELSAREPLPEPCPEERDLAAYPQSPDWESGEPVAPNHAANT